MRGGRRPGAGMKPTCTCGTCCKCRARIRARRYYDRWLRGGAGPDLPEHLFVRVGGDVRYLGEAQERQ